MFTESTIDQFIVKVRLQATIEGIDEKAALGCVSARLRLVTGEITKSEYHQLIDEIYHIFAISTELYNDKLSVINHWIKQQINEIKTTLQSS
ncbi:photosystem I assembly protein [Crocosphaera sp.]|uniref:photosystem I assembly protein n=1 Tax=Crocosphaera sp. TaxID=2729996 RepID=UPI0026191705|nr:photosystem I assembly protein [Crocosphaera sp.]MDJ0580238.1 photosystem I assembly protein [Crocosphaera sp.]